MPATGQDVAYRIADNLREVVERLRIVHGARGADEFVTLSIGVATQFPKKGHPSDRLLTEADQALYIAKRCGRNRVISANNALAELAKAGKTRSRAILARAK
jgi:diguanylate cyclase (GGDEF)-like protein